jgi:hypothetical protein
MFNCFILFTLTHLLARQIAYIKIHHVQNVLASTERIVVCNYILSLSYIHHTEQFL